MLARDASTTVQNTHTMVDVVLPGQYFDKRPANNRGQTTVFRFEYSSGNISPLKTVVCPLLFRIAAYEALGAALHTVMDSTSPSHRGFQIWDPAGETKNSWHSHGNNSPEDLKHLTDALKAETLKLMRDAMNGSPCGCTQ